MKQGELMTLDALCIGHRAIIEGFSSENEPDKYLELGVIPGAECILIRKAPLGGPYCIQLCDSGSTIALRKSEASKIKVSLVHG